MRHSIIEWNNGMGADTPTRSVYMTACDFRDWHVQGFMLTKDDVRVWIDGASLAWDQTYIHSRNMTTCSPNIWLTLVAYKETSDKSKLPGLVRSAYIRYHRKDYYLMRIALRWLESTSPPPSNSSYSETNTRLDSSLEGCTRRLRVVPAIGPQTWAATIK
ncbi:hypothetical protein FPV67DRAFT_585224 [Lyophyllum atratum]|nr:hypothetical protein FPV67DRAFT_585224 [Lyophyllum atratum]